MIYLASMTSSNENQTLEIAGYLTQKIFRPGIPIFLSGRLGVGKTYFAKGIAQALGISRREVVSPSFALIHEYRGPVFSLNHMDFYRLDSWQEVEQLGLDEYLTPDSFTIIEWGDRFISHFSPPYFVVKISEIDDHHRLIEVYYNE